MTISRNEFLRLIVEAHASALDEIGNIDFWVDQYYLWEHEGVRDGRIHDTTAKVMIPHEASQKVYTFNLEFDSGATHTMTSADIMCLTLDKIKALEEQYNSKCIAGVTTDAKGRVVGYWNDDIGIVR